MDPLDFTIPTAFNTLDDEPFDDGHPVSSWAGRELLHNDRGLHASLRRCLLNVGWDVANPLTYSWNAWARVAAAIGPTSPGQETVTVAIRCLITNNREVSWVVQTYATRPGQRDVLPAWTTTTGTGAAQDVTITGVPVRAGAMEQVEVFALPRLLDVNTSDVIGDVVSIGVADLVSAGVQLAGVGVGWSIQVYDQATGDNMSPWMPITGMQNNNQVFIFPGWPRWVSLNWWVDDSGAAKWRARPSAQLELYSVAIDEDELAGELGA